MNIIAYSYKVYRSSFDRVEGIAHAVQHAVWNVAQTLYTSTAEVAREQINDSLIEAAADFKEIENSVISSEKALKDTGHQLFSELNSTLKSAADTVDDLLSDVRTIVEDFQHGKFDPDDGKKLLTDFSYNLADALHNASRFAQSSELAAYRLYSATKEGSTFHVGDNDSLLGITVTQSLFKNENGSTSVGGDRPSHNFGPAEINISEHQLNGIAEAPLMQLVTAALSLNAITAPLVPFLAPLDLGGVGLRGGITNEGFNIDLYGVFGPKYNIGGANIAATLEVGLSNEVNLFHWSNLKLANLPLIGEIFENSMLKNASVPILSLDLDVDSKIYLDGDANIRIDEFSPKFHIEIVHDVDHDLSIIADIMHRTAGAAQNSAWDVARVIFDVQSQSYNVTSDSSIELIGVQQQIDQPVLNA